MHLVGGTGAAEAWHWGGMCMRRRGPGGGPGSAPAWSHVPTGTMDFLSRVAVGTLQWGAQLLVQGTGGVMGSKDSCGTFHDSLVATLDVKEGDIRRKAVPHLHGGERGTDSVWPGAVSLRGCGQELG